MSYRTKTGRISENGRRQAERARIFAETFLTFAGNDEKCGDPYEVSDWLYKNVWLPLFGTGRMVGRKWRRRFRQVLLGLHRYFGKSQLAAVIILTVATMEPVANGQYGIIADTKDNTAMIKDYIKTMIRASPQLSREWSIYKDEIKNERTGQTIVVFPYKEAALQGKHFNVLVGDEVHVWRDDTVWGAAVSGQGKVPNALMIGITTAGASRDGFLFKKWRELKTKKEAFICWLGIDDGDDPEDRRCWRKITAAGRMSMEELESMHDALTAKDFERYILNRTPMDEVEEPFMRRADVEACQRREGSVDHSEWFCVGIDGAVSGDTLAIVAAQRQGDEWAFEEWCWDRPESYGTYDLLAVSDVILMLTNERGRPLVCCDPARMQFLTNWMQRTHGVELFSVAQTPSVMCPASELLARSVKTHVADMKGLRFLPQHCVNAVSSESKAYGRRLASVAHGQGSKRIDAAVAAAMAMWAYDNNDPGTTSVWTIDL